MHPFPTIFLIIFLNLFSSHTAHTFPYLKHHFSSQNDASLFLDIYTSVPIVDSTHLMLQLLYPKITRSHYVHYNPIPPEYLPINSEYYRTNIFKLYTPEQSMHLQKNAIYSLGFGIFYNFFSPNIRFRLQWNRSRIPIKNIHIFNGEIYTSTSRFKIDEHRRSIILEITPSSKTIQSYFYPTANVYISTLKYGIQYIIPWKSSIFPHIQPYVGFDIGWIKKIQMHIDSYGSYETKNKLIFYASVGLIYTLNKRISFMFEAQNPIYYSQHTMLYQTKNTPIPSSISGFSFNSSTQLLLHLLISLK